MFDTEYVAEDRILSQMEGSAVVFMQYQRVVKTKHIRDYFPCQI